MSIKAPFPWFGGKSRASNLIWSRLGDVPNYVEPFAGSLAVLLARPTTPNTETVNDLDHYLANFWRAITWRQEETAKHADWPVNEADLLARHRHLLAEGTTLRDRLRNDPAFCDPLLAGWWVWGICSWIGSGWCECESEQLPHLGNAGKGINRKLPHLGNAGQGIADYFEVLSQRLRRVRVACGDWSRVLTPSVTTKHGLTGVVLDPPYTEGDLQYSARGCGGAVANAVREWAIANGSDPLLRIALCGYEGEHAMPEGWECVPWKARKGYQQKDNALNDRLRERIWFSPFCLNSNQKELFT